MIMPTADRLPLLLALTVAFASSLAGAAIVDGVAVVVNGDVITLSELEDRVGTQLPPGDAEGDLLRRRKTLLKRAAEDAVAEKLVEKEAEAEGLVPTKAEIENAIDDVKRANKIDDATLETALKQQGLSMESYRKMLLQQLTRMKVVEMRVKSRISVSEDDVKARYAKMTGDVKTVDEIKLRDIFLPRGDDALAAREKAEAARARAVAGEDFTKVAEETGGPLAVTGGDLGWVRPGMVLPEIEKSAFALETGEISPVLDTSVGFHVLKVEDRRSFGGARPLSEAREEIRQQLLAERLEKATGEYLSELKRSADVEYRLQ